MSGHPRTQARPSGLQRGYTSTWTGQLHHRIIRPAAPTHRPLVCLHLSPGSGRMYEAFLLVMGRDRLAVAFDTPGFGASDPPPAPPSIADYARAIIEACDALDIEEFDVMGYHTGSKIAVALAETWPHRARRLVLVSAPIYTPEELEAHDEYFLHPHRPREDGTHLVGKWEELWEWRGPDRTLEMVQRELAEQLRAGAISWWGHHAAFGFRHEEHLPAVADRTLVVCPGDDLQQPTRRARRLLPPGQFIDRPAWGHGLLDTRTDEVSALVRYHLDR